MHFFFRGVLGTFLFSSVQFSSVQDGIYTLGKAHMRSTLSISEVYPTMLLKRFQCSSDWRWPYLVLSKKTSSASSFHASLLKAIDSVMSLALCPQVVFQATQHFRSSEKRDTCEGCFARQSICSVISHHSGMSRAVHPPEFWKVHADHWHIVFWASHSTFHFL